MSLYLDVKQLTHSYVRKGGKCNRNQQRKRMLSFAKHVENLGAKSMGQVGRRHVILYWKANRDLSSSTLYNHWLAIRELWALAGKIGDPPKPNTENMDR